MGVRGWDRARFAAGVVLVAGAAAAVAAGLTWVPMAAVGALVVLVLLREPPQGATEWLVILGFVVAIAVAGIVLTSDAR